MNTKYMLESDEEFISFLENLPEFVRTHEISLGNFWIMIADNGELIVEHKDKHNADFHPMKQVTGCNFGKDIYSFCWNDCPYMFADGRIATIAAFWGFEQDPGSRFFHELTKEQIKW